MAVKLFGTILFVLSSFVTQAQNENVISGPTASELNGKVLLTWAIKQGFTCNGIQVLRSTDSVTFTQIGSINGVCGSTLEEVPYEYTDTDPVKNTVNYYRLHLGGVGFSKIVSVDVIDISDNSYLIRPNPISDSSELHFKNDASNLVDIRIFNEMGIKVKEVTTGDAMIYLSKSDFASGTYIFIVIDEARNTTVKGRFMVP